MSYEFSRTDFDDSEPGGSSLTPAEGSAGLVNPSGYENLTRSNTDYLTLESDAFNNPAGNTSQNYTMPGAYTVDASGNKTTTPDYAGFQKFLNDNKSLITAGGAALGLMGGNDPKYGKTGYQGSIPNLMATRNMISAPPTKAMGYRPGAGGIDYGGDVTYSRLADGVDPFVNLRGNTGTLANANLGGLGSLTPGGLKTSTVVGGKGKDTITGGTGNDKVTTIVGGGGNDTLTGAKGNDTITKTNLGSVGYQNAIKAGLTPAQYLNNINQWLIDNPRASKAQIDAAMKQFGVSDTDLQEALRTTNFSDYTKYGLTHGMGLQELNFAISNFVEKNPYATNKQIQDAMKAAGVNDEDIARGLNALSASAGKEYAIIHDMGLDQLYKNILDYQAAGHSPAEVAAVMAKYGIEQRDINKANKYAADTGYKANPTSYAGIGDYSNLGGGSGAVKDAVVASGNTGAVKDTVVASGNAGAANNTAVSSGLDTSNEIYKYFADPKTQAALASGDTRSVAETMQELGYSPAEVAAATGTNVADVQAAYDAALSQGSTSSSDSGSSNEIYDYFASPEVQAALASGDTRGIAETMQERGYSPADVAAATGTNVADVQAAYDAALGVGQEDTSNMQFAQGGEIAMAKGRYLQGGTDGMADELPAQIGKDQPAALSHGEFVIPADVVSHMGNGNSDAGAKKLYQMMDKIRMARTGNKKQGKKINPDKFMPGGLASAYAKGGSVKHFVTGGSTVPAGTTGVESSLSNYAGPYVTNMLGQGQALANMPYQAYMGPLTAGESPLQTGAFNTAADLTTPASIGKAATTAGGIASTAAGLAYKPTTSSFDATQAQSYMNPYLQSSLNPQLDEARRQSQITQQQNAAKMTQAGAFGGSRQAILDAETQRSLGSNLANITGQGYNTAYDKATQQFNADQQRKMQEAQYGAGFGLQGLQTGLQAAQAQGSLGAQENQIGLANLGMQLGAGQQQRGIESEGIAADKAQFEEARANPYKMLQYQQSLLQGLPLEAKNYTGIQQSDLVKAAQGATTVAQLLKNLGISI